MPSTSRCRGSGGGPNAQPGNPLIAPMSERQQMALVMQLSQETPPDAPAPVEEGKRSKQHRNQRGETPLHVAAIRGDRDQVKTLLHQGQDPDAVDFAGWTPLHDACSYGWLPVAQVLVEFGANVNAKGLDDDTPLHDASTSGNLNLVEYLVENGADPFVKNAKGKTPADYAAPHISNYLASLKDSNSRNIHAGRSRDESGKKVGNASGSVGDGKRANMDGLAQEHEAKESPSGQDKNNAESKDEAQLSSFDVSSSQDDNVPSSTGKRQYSYEDNEAEPEDDSSKRRKRKDDEKEPMGKPAPVSRSTTGRALTKPPGPASKTGAAAQGKSGQGAGTSKGSGSGGSGKGTATAQKGSGGSKSSAQSSHQGKSSSGKSSSASQGKGDRKSPVASPKSGKDTSEADSEENRREESSAPKVPPLKIVIPGGAASSANRNEQEGEGGSGQRGSGKGRGGSSTLPYVIHCSSTETGQASDSSDGNSDDKRITEGKGGQRVLRSHRTTDGGDKERVSPAGTALSANKSPPPNNSGQDDHQTSTVSSSNTSRSESGSSSVDLHPRKRKIKASKDSHSRESKNADSTQESSQVHTVTHSNPYQMYIQIRKQIDSRQKSLFPVKPKPPKDFNKYLMNRRTYTLQSTVGPPPQPELPPGLPPAMRDEFLVHEKERHKLRVQHLIEKEKLVLAVEQEILRVHGRAERAVANQALPFSVCTILRDEEVYNVLAPEQEEKRNAQRSRCNGRQINSWLQEVDDKWEKLKENMLRRQHTEAETLHAVQKMGWEWKLKELGLCDYKTTPKIDATHVPQVHVSNFDLPA